MAEPNIFKPVNRLAKIVDAPGASSPQLLINMAESNVASLGETLRAHVREEVEKILAHSQLGQDELKAHTETIGASALSIAEVAGAAKMETIGEVARGISAMIFSLNATGVWRPEALVLHMQFLSMAYQSGRSRPEDSFVLARLASMRKVIGVIE